VRKKKAFRVGEGDNHGPFISIDGQISSRKHSADIYRKKWRKKIVKAEKNVAALEKVLENR
jgi:hypothetical protein